MLTANAETSLRACVAERDRLEIFKKDLQSFSRFYEFMAQIIEYNESELEKLNLFAKHLRPLLREKVGDEGDDIDLSSVVMTHYRLSEIRKQDLLLKQDSGEYKLEPGKDIGSGKAKDKLEELADDKNVHSKMWIYALTHDNGRTYYVVAGYSVYLHPHPLEHSRYVILDLGTVFAIEGNECVIFGEGRETFDARYFEETPQRVLVALACDLASRLASGFGGPDRLSAELRKQHIPVATLSPELNEAFQPYFRKEVRR